MPDGVFPVMTRGAGRRLIFIDDHDRRRFISLLRQTATRCSWLCHAYCLMGNHYHVVVETTQASLAAGMRRVNGLYAQGFNARHGRSGHLFGSRYEARVVEGDDSLHGTCRYVLDNPVRARLCRDAAEWPWSGLGLDATSLP